MKFYTTIIAFYFFCIHSYSQIDSIQLPKVDMKIGTLVEPHFDFYVTKNGSILYEKDTIKIYEVKQVLYRPIRNYGLSMMHAKKYVHIFADERVNYSLIDSIKTEIASTNSSRYIIYRSNLDSKHRRNIKGIKHQSPISYFSYLPLEYIPVQDDSEAQEHLNEDISDFPRVPNKNSVEWKHQTSIETAVYSLQKDLLNDKLKSISYECLTMTNNGLFDKQNKLISKETLRELLAKNEAIFLSYASDLKYGKYISTIALLKELKPNFESLPNLAEIIEIFAQIQKLHKEVGIQLCD